MDGLSASIAGRRWRWIAMLAVLYALIGYGISKYDQQRDPNLARVSDQLRYRGFAENIVAGAYTSRERPELTNGPGYPLVLVPFAALDVPWQFASVLNIAFVVMGVIYLNANLRLYVSDRAAALGSLALAFYPPLLIYLPYQVTEPFAVFLISGASYHLSRGFLGRSGRDVDVRHAALAVTFLAYLAMTKVFFGYVITAGLAISLFAVPLTGITRRTSAAAAILAGAIVLCVPWLAYTYSLTDRPYYWGTGGQALYWMTSPYSGEYGNSYEPEDVANHAELLRNHGALFKQLHGLSPVERSEMLTQAARNNLVEYPVKYLTNVVCNIGRMIFNLPFSYTPQKPSTLFYLVPNVFLLVPGVVALCILGRLLILRRTSADKVVLPLFLLVAFGGSALVAAAARQFTILVPLILVVIAQGIRAGRLPELARWLLDDSEDRGTSPNRGSTHSAPLM